MVGCFILLCLVCVLFCTITYATLGRWRPRGSTKVVCPCLLHVLDGLDQLQLLLWEVALKQCCDALNHRLLGHCYLSTPLYFDFDTCDHVYYMAKPPNLLAHTLGVRGKALGVRAT